MKKGVSWREGWVSLSSAIAAMVKHRGGWRLADLREFCTRIAGQADRQTRGERACLCVDTHRLEWRCLRSDFHIVLSYCLLLIYTCCLRNAWCASSVQRLRTAAVHPFLSRRVIRDRPSPRLSHSFTPADSPDSSTAHPPPHPTSQSYPEQHHTPYPSPLPQTRSTPLALDPAHR